MTLKGGIERYLTAYLPIGSLPYLRRNLEICDISADKYSMSSSGIGVDGLSSTYLLALRGTAIESTGVAATGSATSAHSGGSSPESDSSELSPLAKLASLLEHLREQDLNTYRRITAQIASNLKNASPGSDLLSRIAADFAHASETGESVSMENLAEAANERYAQSIDPMAIIFQTLASAGIPVG